MSRVGTSNFKHSRDVPERHDAFWREGLNRKTWNLLAHTNSIAARTGSYDQNVMYPHSIHKFKADGPKPPSSREHEPNRIFPSARSTRSSAGSVRSARSGRSSVRAVSMGRTVNQPEIPSF